MCHLDLVDTVDTLDTVHTVDNSHEHHNNNVQKYRGGPFRAENRRKSTFGTGIRIPRAPGAQKKGSGTPSGPKKSQENPKPPKALLAYVGSLLICP